MVDHASNADKLDKPQSGGQGKADPLPEACLRHLKGKPESFRNSCDVTLVLDSGEKLPAHKCAPSSSAEAPTKPLMLRMMSKAAHPPPQYLMIND